MIRSVTPGAVTRRYEGSYDPFATFSRLRDGHVLGPYSYLHVGPEGAEMGWAPIARLALLATGECDDWRGQVRAFAHRASRYGSKAVGYIGFDAVDRRGGVLPDASVNGRPLVEFIIPGEVLRIARDHAEHVGMEPLGLDRYLSTRSLHPAGPIHSRMSLVAQTPEEEFLETVRRALKAIASGSIQKAVLSRYEAYETDFEPVSVLAALAPPQTGSFLLWFDDLVAVVPSPEVLLAGSDRRIVTNPLAGTRRRGRSAVEDQQLCDELRSSHKEIVEHVLAVTTMCSELATVCDPDTVCVRPLMEVVRHRRVQHLSSVVRATLAGGREVLDALWALFPSVTVTGAPKAAALREVRALEGHPRFLYSGAIGWVSGADDCELMLAIRSVFRHGGRAFLHAGAGIVAGSHPPAELAETRHKLSAMKDAIAGIQV